MDKFEWLSAVLVALDKVDQRTINDIMAKFDELDADGSGEIDMEDVALEKAMREQAEVGRCGTREGHAGAGRGTVVGSYLHGEALWAAPQLVPTIWILHRD